MSKSTKTRAKRAPKADVAVVEVAPVEETESGETTGKRSMSETLAKYRANYAQTVVQGKLAINNGDSVAQLLIPLTPDRVCRVAETLLEMKKGELQEKYGHLNQGQIRMNSGNRIRAGFKSGKWDLETLKSVINSTN